MTQKSTTKPRAKTHVKTANRAAMDSAVKRPRIVSVDVIIDDEAADAYEQGKKEFDALERRLLESRPRRLAAARAALPASADPEDQAQTLAAVSAADDLELDAARADLEDLREVLEAGTLVYKFRALGRRRWEELKAEHPPTEADHQAAREATGNKDDHSQWHHETLAPALIRESCVSPRLTQEDVDDIFEGDAWNDAEITRLFQAALIAQVSAHPNPLGRAS